MQVGIGGINYHAGGNGCYKRSCRWEWVVLTFVQVGVGGFYCHAWGSVWFLLSCRWVWVVFTIMPAGVDSQKLVEKENPLAHCSQLDPVQGILSDGTDLFRVFFDPIHPPLLWLSTWSSSIGA